MAKCALTGKSRKYGNKISHSNIKTRVYKSANIQKRRVFDPVTGKTFDLYLTARALRTIDKIGIQAYVKKLTRTKNCQVETRLVKALLQ